MTSIMNDTSGDDDTRKEDINNVQKTADEQRRPCFSKPPKLSHRDISTLSQDLSILLAPKARKKKKAKIPTPILEVTRATLSDSGNDDDPTTNLYSVSSTSTNVKVSEQQRPFLSNAGAVGVSVLSPTHDISSLSQELGQLLVVKPKKKLKSSKQKIPLNCTDLDESKARTLVTRSTKRKNQLSGQSRVLNEISAFLISDNSSGDEKASSSNGGFRNMSDKENIDSRQKMIYVNNITTKPKVENISGNNEQSSMFLSNVKTTRSTSKKGRIGSEGQLLRDLTQFIMSDSDSADEKCLAVTEEIISQEEPHMKLSSDVCNKDLSYNCKAMTFQDNSEVEQRDCSKDRLSNCQSVSEDYEDAISDISSTSSTSKKHGGDSNSVLEKADDSNSVLEKADGSTLFSNKTGNDLSMLSEKIDDSNSFSGKKCDDLKSLSSQTAKDSKSFSEKPWDNSNSFSEKVGDGSNSLSEHDSNSLSKMSNLVASNGTVDSANLDMSILSQEIVTLLMTKPHKKGKKKVAQASTEVTFTNLHDRMDNFELHNTKRKKHPSNQSVVSKEISELALSDSSSDSENFPALSENGGLDTKTRPNLKDHLTSQKENDYEDAIECKLELEGSDQHKVIEQRTQDSVPNVSSFSDQSHNPVGTNYQSIEDESTKTEDFDDICSKSDNIHKSPACVDTSKKTNCTGKLFFSKDTLNDLWSSSDEIDVSDESLSKNSTVKTVDHQILSVQVKRMILSDLSSDEAPDELYTTALKLPSPERQNPALKSLTPDEQKTVLENVTPEGQKIESDSEDDQFEHFLQNVKSSKPANDISDTSDDNDSSDDFIVSDNASLSGDDNEALYTSTLGNLSEERSCEANTDSNVRSGALATFRRKETSNSYRTPKMENLFVSSDSDEAFLAPTKPLFFKTPLCTNAESMKSFRTPKLEDLSMSSDSEEDLPVPTKLPIFKTPKTINASNIKAVVTKPARCSFLQCLSAANSQNHQKDCEAISYIKHFKKNKEELTNKLYAMFNKTVFEDKLPADMSLQWNSRLLKTAGYCSYKRKIQSGTTVERTASIELSTKVCDTAERVRDTLVHEMCHAAVWLLHGSKEGHGPIWKLFARKANRVHPEVPTISRCHDYSINTKYAYRCTGCSYEIGRHSKSLDTEKKVCGYCRSPFQLHLNSAKTPNLSKNMNMTPKTPRTPNAFALFVKENYGSVKKENKGIAHKDVMLRLSQDFQAEKKKLSL